MERFKEKIKYFLYARKSSESEDRQVASIDSQIEVLTEMAKREGLEVVEIFSESKSAKAPGRVVFNKMIEKIYKGEAQGIICWKLDRLARNPIDGGQIMWMLQQGIIKHIKTHERSYYPTDNVLMMSVEFGMANQWIRDLSENTKRGLKTKAERGWYPGPAPLGYLNSPFKRKGEKEIIKDPERFDLVRKMFDLMLTGIYSPRQIWKKATEEWGLRNKKGGKFSLSTLYRIFTNPFYYGIFEYPRGSGNWYQGKHEPMINAQEYDKIQALLGRKGNPRPKSRVFAFRGLMRCGECGCSITAEEKIKKQKNGNVHRYVYYHCTKKRNPNCSQRSVEEKELEKQIIEILERITIPPEFHRWALKWLKKENEKEAEDRNKILANLQREYEKCVKKIDALIDMRAGGEISEEEFLAKKSELVKEKVKLEELLRDTENRINQWIERAEELFNFARDAKRKFESGTLEEKRQILACLGSNLLLKDGILLISIQKPLILMEKIASEVKKVNSRLELPKNGKNEFNLEEIYEKNSVGLRRWDSNPQPTA